MLAVLVTALVAGGCTADTDGTTPEADATAPAAGSGGYAGEFDDVTQHFRVRSEDLQSRAAGVADSPERIVALYRELRTIAADAREDYGELAAPAEVRSTHQQILQLFDRQVGLLDDVITAAEDSDPERLATAVQGLVDLTADFDRARQAMEQAIAACGAPCTT